METLSVKVDPERKETIQDIAEEYDATQSEVLRHLLDNGIRAHKYYDGFEIRP